MKRKIYLIALAITLLGSSCTDNWLDVNDNPNLPKEATAELVFPAALVSVTNQVTVGYNISGGMWSQYWTQNPTSNQYKQYDSYDVTNTTLTAEWQELYTGTLKDLWYVKDEAQKRKEWRLNLMATVMQAYTWQLLVDLYDNIPYSEALNGEGGNLSPKFDDGSVIYKDLIAKIDTALSKDMSSFTYEISSDFVFKGDYTKWVQLANTLKLKLYIRQYAKNTAYSKAGIQKLIDEGANFLTTDAKVDVFVDAKGKGNPLFESDQRELNTTNNIRASHTFISWLSENSDPRINFYFKPGTGGQKGNYQGDFNIPITAEQANVYSLAKINATDPTYVISAAESYFLQAEAYFNLGNLALAKTAYDKGVLAAFSRCGFDGSSFIAVGGAYEFNVAKPLESIIVQKWASLCGINGMEAYLEHLRTGYPIRSKVSGSDDAYIAGTFTQPVNSVLPKGSFVKRLVIPDIETKRNKNTPKAEPTTVPVWWNTLTK